jgi:hypothetical protein
MGSDFGNNASVAGVDFHLRGNLVGKNFNAVFHHRGGSFITGCFNTQYFHTI